MKLRLTVMTLATLLCTLILWRSSASGNNVEDQLRQMEQQWLDAAAVPDLPALRKMFADDFMGTAFGPKVLSKEDIIPPDGSTQQHLPKCLLRQSSVRVYGDVAVLMGDVQPQNAGENGYRVTTVFQKRAPGWQIIAIHMSSAAPQE
jgi:ketosteroid isomerase-like protein